MRLLVTGGAGFIGSCFVRRHLARRPDDGLVVLDALTYAGRRENLDGLGERHAGYRFLRGDIAERADVERAFDLAAGPVDVLVHFAAESHVDRSIDDAEPFVRTNVLGTQRLLEASLRRGVGRFVHVSTDEVYGALTPDEPAFTESSPLAPSSPYAASKAASDCFARAYAHTYALPVVITRSSNNYGPFQFAEKFIPNMVTRALTGQPLPIYGDGKQRRDWIHVEDHADAIEAVIERGRDGEVYNVGARQEIENLEIARTLLRLVGAPDSLLRHVEDRKGHDRRYAIDPTRLERDTGFRAARPLAEGLESTVRWYREHPEFWRERRQT